MLYRSALRFETATFHLCTKDVRKQAFRGMNAMANQWIDSSVKGFLLDISGVIYDSDGSDDGGVAVPGSIEAVKLLRTYKIPFHFCTNETTASRRLLCAKLNRIGYDIKPDEVTSPAPIAAKILQERHLRPYVLVTENVVEEFDGINTINPNCVVVGDAQHNFSYENMNRAFSILMSCRKPPILISMGMGRYYKETDGLKMDVGPYCRGLEYACDVTAEVIGKPQKSFFLSACDALKVPFGNVVMIGDDVRSDIGGAKSAGMKGVLVRTGKYRAEDEKRSDVKPDGVVDNLLSAVTAYIDFLKTWRSYESIAKSSG